MRSYKQRMMELDSDEIVGADYLYPTLPLHYRAKGRTSGKIVVLGRERITLPW